MVGETESVGAVGDSLREVPKTRPEDQALPTPGAEPVQDRLTEFVELVRYRRELGVQRYGRLLETHNGRDAGQDLVEELVDAACYAMQVRLERRDLEAGNAELRELLRRANAEVRAVRHRGERAVMYLSGQLGELVREDRRTSASLAITEATMVLRGFRDENEESEEASGAVRE